jgi:hypothetical protein
MSRRSRRLRKPWIPGFWTMMAALILGGSLFGCYWLLARSTQFQHAAPAEAQPVKSAK